MHDTAHDGCCHRESRIAALAGPLALCCWGALFLAFFARGDLAVFVSPFFRPLVAGAGATLTILGVLLCLLPKAHGPCCHAGDGSHEHDHGSADGHDHGDALSLRLALRTFALFAPLVLLLWIRPEGFSSTTVKNRGIIRQPPPSQRQITARIPTAGASAAPAAPLQMPAEDIFNQFQDPEEARLPLKAATQEGLSVYDIIVASADPELRQRLTGSTVRVLGQLVRDSKNPARFDLVRMFIVCCAADARVLGLKVEGGDAPSLDEMAWIEVEGKVDFEEGPGIPQPLLRATRVTEAEEPDEPFLY